MTMTKQFPRSNQHAPVITGTYSEEFIPVTLRHSLVEPFPDISFSRRIRAWLYKGTYLTATHSLRSESRSVILVRHGWLNDGKRWLSRQTTYENDGSLPLESMPASETMDPFTGDVTVESTVSARPNATRTFTYSNENDDVTMRQNIQTKFSEAEWVDGAVTVERDESDESAAWKLSECKLHLDATRLNPAIRGDSGWEFKLRLLTVYTEEGEAEPLQIGDVITIAGSCDPDDTKVRTTSPVIISPPERPGRVMVVGPPWDDIPSFHGRLLSKLRIEYRQVRLWRPGFYAFYPTDERLFQQVQITKGDLSVTAQWEKNEDDQWQLVWTPTTEQAFELLSEYMPSGGIAEDCLGLICYNGRYAQPGGAHLAILSGRLNAASSTIAIRSDLIIHLNNPHTGSLEATARGALPDRDWSSDSLMDGGHLLYGNRGAAYFGLSDASVVLVECRWKLPDHFHIGYHIEEPNDTCTVTLRTIHPNGDFTDEELPVSTGDDWQYVQPPEQPGVKKVFVDARIDGNLYGLGHPVCYPVAET